MRHILRGLKALQHLEEALLVLAFVGLVGLAFLQVVLRNGFGTSLIWADVAVRILVLWVTMLGAMVATQRKKHIKIDLAGRYFTARQSRYVHGGGRLVAAGIMFVVAYYCYEMVLLEYEFGTMAFANIPTWVCQSILPLGFFSIGVQFFVQSFMYLRGLDA